MSFVLPTTITIVNKFPPRRLDEVSTGVESSPPSLWQLINKYDTFRELVKTAHMEDILNDPQTKLTLFIPLDFSLPTNKIFSCIDREIKEKDTLSVNFETARTIVNSLIIPSVLSTTMMIQSAFRRYKTRNTIHTLAIETPHCVQFEPQTFNKPPFGIILNGRSRILTPDIFAANGMVHTIDIFPYII
jgi:hypothetical protein